MKPYSADVTPRLAKYLTTLGLWAFSTHSARIDGELTLPTSPVSSRISRRMKALGPRGTAIPRMTLFASMHTRYVTGRPRFGRRPSSS